MTSALLVHTALSTEKKQELQGERTTTIAMKGYKGGACDCGPVSDSDAMTALQEQAMRS